MDLIEIRLNWKFLSFLSLFESLKMDKMKYNTALGGNSSKAIYGAIDDCLTMKRKQFLSFFKLKV